MPELKSPQPANGAPQPATGGLKPPPARTRWHLLANLPVFGWFVAAAVVAIAHREIAASSWLLVHLTMLGAVTNAILIWSAHFTDALLRRPPARRGQAVRLIALNLAVLVTVFGLLSANWPLVLAGAAGVGATVAAHGTVLWWAMRRALSGRFAVCVRFYVAAAWLLPIGASYGVWLAWGLPPHLHARVVLGHVAINLLGFVGLTAFGTLITFWPTVLRTAMPPRGLAMARPILGLLVAGLVAAAGGSTADLRWLALAGISLYLLGVVLAGGQMWRAARQRPPANFAGWSIAAAFLWLVAGLSFVLVAVARGGSWLAISGRLGAVIPVFVAGFAVQLVLGALTYLIPVVLGGGPSISRATAATSERAAAGRVAVTNGALLLFVLPTPSVLRALCSIAALIACLWALPLFVTAVIRFHRLRRQKTGPNVAAGPQLPARSPVGSLIAGVSVLLLIAAGAVAIDPTSFGAAGTKSAAGSVTATGETTRVTITAADMRFQPAQISVPAGNRLILTVHNTDATTIHDLALDTGAHTGRIASGAQTELDVGVVGRDISGWCTIVGHKQMGMTFKISADGAPGADAPPNLAVPPGSGPASDQNQSASALDNLDWNAAPAPNAELHDATLTGPGAGKTHRVTLKVTDKLVEVAPGVRQTVWTFGETAPGPTLHGKVGDRFEITLVNDGTIGHSIDFHAGMLAPDQPMRTINPGETLTYNFTATHSGIWLYHCSTAPMSSHIANGMFGAVIIDPPGLAPVAKQFVLVQSDMYLGEQDGVVDAAKVATQQPDLVVFNGYANQYVHRPLEVRAGERVRVWVLAAGPNKGSSFHVIGSQFDTVFHEGAYTLRRGNKESGGSQALGLSVAQGGFVELQFPEPGNYPFVTHVMSDAEKGAKGLFHVTAAK